ncbi:MAG: hypothetical protein NT038_05380 [Euryarchaeota archaeon]|nr:hypothetical protein [Euryarchaeota archaeon]
MDEKDMKNIAKIVTIIAIVLCIVSLILPWNSFSVNLMGINMGADFYPWSGHVFVSGSFLGQSSTSADIWMILYTYTVGTAPTGSSTTTNPTAGNNTAIALFILSFIFVIIALIFGLLSIRSIKQNKSMMPLIAAIVSLLAIILFFAGISTVLSSDTTGTAGNMFKWTYGFFTMIITMILFFVSFGLLKSIKPAMPTMQTTETVPPAQ